MFLNFTDLFDNTYELLRCFATLAILKTFGFASLHPHVFGGDQGHKLSHASMIRL